MLTGAKKKRRKWGHDEFSDLPVSRQRKWQLRMLKENRCCNCGQPLGPEGCPRKCKTGRRGKYRITWGVIGPCIANMLRAGMTVPEIEKDMNTTRHRIYQLAKSYGVDVKKHHLFNIRIFLKESLNGNDTAPLQAQSKIRNA